MKNPLKTPASANLGMLLVRLSVGATFAYAGYFKIFTMGVKTFVDTSLRSSAPYMPEALGRAYLYALPEVELLVGVMIILGWFTRIAGFISSLILISIIIAVTGWKDTPSSSPHPNVILLGVTLMLMFTGPGKFAMDSIRLGSGAAKSKPPA